MTERYWKEASSYWIDIAGICIGGLVGVLLSFVCLRSQAHQSWLLPAVFGLVSALLGFFMGVAYKLLCVKPAKDAEDYERHREEFLGIIVPHISVVPLRDEHPLVFRLLSSYAT